MDITEQIDSLVKKAKRIVTRENRRLLINLYAEGLKNKLTEADFAIKKLQLLTGRSDKLETHTMEEDKIEDQRYFYSDAFWAFLYSSLDVLAQLANQALKIGLPENKTDFKKLNGKLQSNEHKDSEVAKIFLKCRRGYAFRRLDKYRNCALHRRHVYFSESFVGGSGSPGYTATGEMQRAVHYLCDDPYVTKPSVKQKIEIPGSMKKMRQEIVNYIVHILVVIEPVK